MRTLGYKSRLVLWHAAIVAVVLGAATFALDWTVRRVVLNQFDAALVHMAQTEAAEIREEDDISRPLHALPSRRVRGLLWSFDPIIQVIDLDGRITALSPGLPPGQTLPMSSALLTRLRRHKVAFETVRVAGSSEVRMVALPVEAAGRVYGVQVAQPLNEAHALLRRLRWVLTGTSLTVLLAIGLTDLLLARRALRPIDAIVRQARRIGDSNLAERLPHPDTPGELARLVDTLNEMLARLHDSFQAQRRFTADAAHELRSPLTRLHTEIEVALRRPRLAEDYRTVLETSLEELRRLARLTENLLALARLDAGEGRAIPAAPTPLAPLLETTRERFAAIGAGREVTVVLDPVPALVVRALPAIVDVVIANVIDNAVKFSPPGGRVAIRATATDADVLVAVDDSGPGIPAEELPHVFERFFRGRSPRATDASGVGLGLAIARTLVERQRGGIAIASETGRGTTVTIRFPLAAAPAEPLAVD